MARSKKLILGMWISAGIASFLSLQYLPGPYIWTFMVWSLTFIGTLILSHRAGLKILSFIFAACFFILSIAEGYFAYDRYMSKHTHTLEHVYNSQDDPLMGYIPFPNTQRTARKLYKDNLIYQVTISINSKGLRISPPYAPRHQSKSQSILFFGCSVTFGEGVNDDETMPYVTGTLINGQYKIFNFAIHGYGPQHMLAAIDHDLVDSVVDIQPRYIIYQATVDHVYRVAGYRSWLKRGPQYILGETGEVTYTGSFNTCNLSHENCLNKQIHRNLKKSYLFQRIWFHRISPTDIDLFLKVVDQSRNLLAKKYPEAEFHVIFWHEPENPVSQKILAGLKQRTFGVHLIEDIIPDYHNNKRRLYLIEGDGHPNARAHRKVAQYITSNIIQSTGDNIELLNPPDDLTAKILE